MSEQRMVIGDTEVATAERVNELRDDIRQILRALDGVFSRRSDLGERLKPLMVKYDLRDEWER